MTIDKLPDGFLAAGRNVGIKTSKRDMGILISDTPAVFAACVTTNKGRAPCVRRTERVRALKKPVRAIIAVSGNANALTGQKGADDDQALAEAIAEHLHVGADEILTASTGVLGHRMPLERIVNGIEALLAGLSSDPSTFAESVMTTDWVKKLATRDVFIEGQRIRIHGVAKGSGMIAPSLATSLCFITTDARIRQDALEEALETAVGGTLNQLTVDGDMSTNDQAFALANGWAENKEITLKSEGYELFAAGLEAVLRELSRAIADDGEGATRLLEVTVQNAATLEDARVISRTIAGSMLVKAAIYGGDSYAWGRIIGAAGAAAARANADFNLDTLSVELQNIRVFENGVAAEGAKSAHLRHKMAEPDIYVTLDLGTGDSTATAWGCDLSYDYVKVNADYAAATATQADGSVAVNERLAELGPSIKKKLLIEALRYIDRFKGIRAVIKIGGEAMVDPRLEEQFADDVLLLRSVGLLPVVVHGGGPEISKTLQRLGIASEFSDGLRITDSSSMPVVEMVLSGSVNQRIVAALNKTGSRAVGLSGKDGGLIRAKKWEQGDRDLGRVGEVVSVNTSLIDMLEKDGYIPVISPVGLGEQGTSYNLSADVVAAELARGLRAEKLVFLSDEPGLLDAGQVISELDSDQLKARIDRGELGAGLRPKLDACLRALANGVSSVHLVDGRVPHNLIAELFTERGVGTLIRRA